MKYSPQAGTGGAEMSGSTFFLQSCPVCGRHLEVRVRFLGKQVSCIHCNGSFVAAYPQHGPAGKTRNDLVGRANRLLREAPDAIS